MKALQLFNPASLERSIKMNADQVLEFLEAFRQLAASRVQSPARVISLRVEASLLTAFKHKVRLEGGRYQTKIKELMRKYLGSSNQD